jgi:hypothetical protein
MEALLRSSVIMELGIIGKESIVKEAQERFKDLASIHPDLREPIYNIVVQYPNNNSLCLFDIVMEMKLFGVQFFSDTRLPHLMKKKCVACRLWVVPKIKHFSKERYS